jgi:hypothetical protein
MSRKYELWFANNEVDKDVEVKIMTIIIDDERFTDYILETIMNNIEYDISELQDNFDLQINNFGILEVKNA